VNRTMTPKVCACCRQDIFVNENGSVYEDDRRMEYHTPERCLARRLHGLERVDRAPCTRENCGHMRQLNAIVDFLGIPRGGASVLDWLRSSRVESWEDRPDEWTDAVKAAHPTRSGSHDEYGVAMQMVGNRHGKYELVALVNWLLVLIDRGERLPGHRSPPRRSDAVILVTRARVAAGCSWTGEDGGHGNKTESQEPEVRRILRECAATIEMLFDARERLDVQLAGCGAAAIGAIAPFEGVLDAVEEETPEEIKQYAPMVRAGLAVLLGVGSQGGKSFGVDTGGGVAVLVRPVDARAVAVRAFNELVADLIPEVTRRGAKAAFKKKLGKKT
jgi:hypothetical protein